IWHDYMVRAIAKLRVEQFPNPPPQKSGTVPNVVGMKQKAAEDTLTKANFVPIDKTVDSSKPAGTVVAQSPGGGATVPLGSAVTIDISNGKAPPPPPKPKKVPVPDVVGETKGQAKNDLTSQGFAVAVTYQTVADPSKDGVVLSQNPPGGTKAPPGSTVSIVVGKKAGPSPSPAPTNVPSKR